MGEKLNLGFKRCPCHNAQQPRRAVANGWRRAKWFIFGSRQLLSKLGLIRQTLNGTESLQSRYLSAPREPPRKQQGFMSTRPHQSTRSRRNTFPKFSTNLNANMFEAHPRLIGVVKRGAAEGCRCFFLVKMKRTGGEFGAVQPLLNKTRESHHQK